MSKLTGGISAGVAENTIGATFDPRRSCKVDRVFQSIRGLEQMSKGHDAEAAGMLGSLSSGGLGEVVMSAANTPAVNLRDRTYARAGAEALRDWLVDLFGLPVSLAQVQSLSRSEAAQLAHDVVDKYRVPLNRGQYVPAQLARQAIVEALDHAGALKDGVPGPLVRCIDCNLVVPQETASLVAAGDAWRCAACKLPRTPAAGTKCDVCRCPYTGPRMMMVGSDVRACCDLCFVKLFGPKTRVVCADCGSSVEVHDAIRLSTDRGGRWECLKCYRPLTRLAVGGIGDSSAASARHSGPGIPNAIAVAPMPRQVGVFRKAAIPGDSDFLIPVSSLAGLGVVLPLKCEPRCSRCEVHLIDREGTTLVHDAEGSRFECDKCSARARADRASEIIAANAWGRYAGQPSHWPQGSVPILTRAEALDYAQETTGDLCGHSAGPTALQSAAIVMRAIEHVMRHFGVVEGWSPAVSFVGNSVNNRPVTPAAFVAARSRPAASEPPGPAASQTRMKPGL